MIRDEDVEWKENGDRKKNGDADGNKRRKGNVNTDGNGNWDKDEKGKGSAPGIDFITFISTVRTELRCSPHPDPGWGGSLTPPCPPPSSFLGKDGQGWPEPSLTSRSMAKCIPL